MSVAGHSRAAAAAAQDLSEEALEEMRKEVQIMSELYHPVRSASPCAHQYCAPRPYFFCRFSLIFFFL